MPKLFWLDCETTGLDDLTHDIVELAVAIADFSKPFEIESRHNWIIHRADWEFVTPFVREMHTKSGLVELCGRSNLSLMDVMSALGELVPVTDVQDERPILAGSTIHFDRGFLKNAAPWIERRFLHRHYDVSSMKLLAESMGMPRIPKGNAHRSMVDIDESIDHARRVVRYFASDWNLAPTGGAFSGGFLTGSGS